MAQTLTGTQYTAAVSNLQTCVESHDMPGFHAELYKLPGDDLYAVMIGTMIENRLRRAKDPTLPCLVVQAERTGDHTEFRAYIKDARMPPPPG